jgi:hypothetical protein
METELGGFIFGVTVTLCLMLVLGMLAFGPQLLEWIEGTPYEQS